MRRLALITISAILLFACNSKNSYTIDGKTDDSTWNGKQVTLFGLSNESGMWPIDSTIIKDGTFNLKGKVDTTGWYVLVLKNDNGQTIYKDFYVEGDLDFTIKDGKGRLNGGPVNNSYQAFEDKSDKLAATVMKLDAQLKANAGSKELQNAFNEEYDRFTASFRKLALKTIIENLDNPLGLHLFQSTMSALENEDLEAVLAKAPPTFLADPAVKMVISQLELLKKVSTGKKFAELSMYKPDNSPMSLSEYAGRGKYVMIDFWASWCVPCMREMPGLLSCYKKFHKKGFEIVGVSLDEDSNAWKAAIKNYKLPWPQMSDLAGWKSQAVSIYSFSGIPHTVLIDPKGIIIASDLRGDDLVRKLEELLGK